MCHSIGNIELYYTSFTALIGLLILLLKKQKPRFGFKTVSSIFLGIAGIFLLAGFFTPPDIISNLILSIPAIIVFLIILIKKHKN